ncbi:MAG TPA: hypothetical protein VH253_10625 [Phycisphaerae bacterium]|nr:hypothetical protein [Phycisphaerae bacterium]
MEHRHHVKTVPGEAKAPEIVPDAEHLEPGGTTQAEDINIPLVATVVAFFAVLLAVSIVSLQAWFYNADTAERARKQLAEFDPNTPLGALVAAQEKELNDPVGWNDRVGQAGQANKIVREPIDRAIDATAKEYAQAQASAK